MDLFRQGEGGQKVNFCVDVINGWPLTMANCGMRVGIISVALLWAFSTSWWWLRFLRRQKIPCGIYCRNLPDISVRHGILTIVSTNQCHFKAVRRNTGTDRKSRWRTWAYSVWVRWGSIIRAGISMHRFKRTWWFGGGLSIHSFYVSGAEISYKKTTTFLQNML